MMLKTLFAEILGEKEEKLTSEVGPHNNKSWTSKIHFELITAMEEIYGILFSRSEILEMKTLGDARKILQSKGVNA